MTGLLWLAVGNAAGQPVVDENALKHSQDVRICGRTNFDREPGILLRGDMNGML